VEEGFAVLYHTLETIRRMVLVEEDHVLCTFIVIGSLTSDSLELLRVRLRSTPCSCLERLVFRLTSLN